jgi:hypothetical protein
MSQKEKIRGPIDFAIVTALRIDLEAVRSRLPGHRDFTKIGPNDYRIDMDSVSHRNFDSKAKATSKDTYVLIDVVHNFLNRGQHPDGQFIHLGVAVATVMTCLELLACLEHEMGA